MILFGGWLLLFNADEQKPNAPITEWKKLREYDTAWLCEEGRRREMASFRAQAVKKGGGPSAMALDAERRYLCERAERVQR